MHRWLLVEAWPLWLSVPALIAVCAWLRGLERPTWRIWLGVALGAGAVALVGGSWVVGPRWTGFDQLGIAHWGYKAAALGVGGLLLGLAVGARDRRGPLAWGVGVAVAVGITLALRSVIP
jgi:drug/metabolite transporter (DMT)-like permease